MVRFASIRHLAAPAVISLLLFLLTLPAVAKDAKRGWLGVTLQDIGSDMAESLGLPDHDGVLIVKVMEDSPAEKAGLADGDVILEFDGQKLADYKALTKVVRAASPGDKVPVVVMRDGKKQEFVVELGERERNTWVFAGDDGKRVKIERLHEKLRQLHDDEDVLVWHDRDGDDEINVMVKDLAGLEGLHLDRGFLGVELDDLNDQMGDYFEVKDGKGALITKVIEDTAADRAGLKAGDVIVRLGDEDIASADDVHDALSDTRPEDELKIEVMRKGKKKKMDLTLGALPEDQFLSKMEFFGDDDHFTVRTPRMLMRGAPRIDREIHIVGEDDEELAEMKDELQKLKEELQKLKDELKK